MKKIFFLSNIYLDDISVGITKKVLAQIDAFNSNSINVEFFSGYVNDGVVIYNSNQEIVYKEKFRFNNKLYIKAFKNQILKKATYNFLKLHKDDIDGVYMRYIYFDYKYYKILKLMKKNNKFTIIEAHTYPIKPTHWLSLKTIVYLNDLIYTKFIRKKIDLVVAICDVKNIWGRKTINIDNAIGKGQIIPKKKKEKSNSQINIISVSTEYNYHGYDRVVSGLFDYYKTKQESDPNIFINFVGTYLQSTISLVDKYNLGKYIKFVGRKTGNELDILYDWADIGLGDLGRHRVGAFSGSCLKTKEYFGKGLPFITSLVEPTYSKDYKYVLQIEADDSPVNFYKVVEFYNICYSDSKLVNNMSTYALEHFTWDKQLLPVFEFIKEFNNENTSN